MSYINIFDFGIRKTTGIRNTQFTYFFADFLDVGHLTRNTRRRVWFVPTTTRSFHDTKFEAFAIRTLATYTFITVFYVRHGGYRFHDWTTLDITVTDNIVRFVLTAAGSVLFASYDWEKNLFCSRTVTSWVVYSTQASGWYTNS